MAGPHHLHTSSTPIKMMPSFWSSVEEASISYSSIGASSTRTTTSSRNCHMRCTSKQLHYTERASSATGDGAAGWQAVLTANCNGRWSRAHSLVQCAAPENTKRACAAAPELWVRRQWRPGTCLAIRGDFPPHTIHTYRSVNT